MARADQKTAFVADARALSAFSAAKAAWWAANGVLARRIAQPEKGETVAAFKPKTPPPNGRFLRDAWFAAFKKDAADVAAGLYPVTENPPATLTAPIRQALDLLSDTRAVDARRRRGQGTEARSEPGAETYPSYYRQNFHYQSGGWFTEQSARRYEAQVEALFSGAAGPMRRRALALLAKAWRDRDQRNLKVLDLACGSGAFLNDLNGAFPRSDIFGLDLSLPYLQEAGRRAPTPRVQAMAERLPFADNALDAVTCVYLFHELPPHIRPMAAAEITRVLKPGGVLAFADSVQTDDAPKIARLLEAFPAFFHEPYYESYQTTDLIALFAAAGLQFKDRDQAFLTKALLFQKP